jgi:2'-5' RNA ligase
MLLGSVFRGNKMPFIRCFIAIELPENVKAQLTELETTLKTRSPQIVKWVEPGGIHLTLKFLGEVPEEQIDEIIMGIEDAVAGTTSFGLEISGVGAFPNLSRVQVVWVGVKGELDKLLALEQRVESNMEQIGFPKENRDFSPHLTLGRVRNEAELADRQKVGKLLSTMTFAPQQTFTTTSVYLIRSQLMRTGAVYTPLKEVKLKES